ncbi:hypothetical protein ABIB57_004920 [Devosia sp. UYZn731]|uniref:hypothetical protein n=1 Tax=Devosia sp. UYZn731 TaxID=3156345 RepID=UPI003397046E
MSKFPDDHNVTDGLVNGIAPLIGKLVISFALLENAVSAMVRILAEGRRETGKLSLMPRYNC